MKKRHIKTLKSLADFFEKPASPRQKQYEAVRALVVDKLPVEQVAKKYGYKTSTVYSLLRDVKAEKTELFPTVRKGPREKRTPPEIQRKVFELRNKGLSTVDIHDRIGKIGYEISPKTVERILKEAGYGKLKRRTDSQLGKTSKGRTIPERSEHIDFSTLEPFNVDCPSVGVFFFIPYILESGILDIVGECDLPESSDIGSVQACLSMLLLKLIGNKRLSHMEKYDREPGLGVFAGLNVLPKPTYMSTYSCRCSQESLMEMQEKVVSAFSKRFPSFYKSDFINLDFHSIPHFGDESEMERVWCGAKGKTMKGANTVVAQDAESNAVVYARADILRKEECEEVKKFVAYWKKVKGNVDETLVFDCKFTTYGVLGELDGDGVKFVTLRKRYASLVNKAENLPKSEWRKVEVSIPKRKYRKVSVNESEVILKGCEKPFRQIIVKDHGRSKPTFILTNNRQLEQKDILEVYARRWRVENKIAEMVAFFNLNALSSPIMVRIHFDILWTVIADTLYHVFAADLRRFEKNLAPGIFRKFIDFPGRVVYDGNMFTVKVRKRAHTPILKSLTKLKDPFPVPWLDGKKIQIKWTA